MAQPQYLDEQDDEVDEQPIHEVEDFENMGHVMNLQIGCANKDFFFRRPESGKPPMPGKQKGMTPERAGMAPPKPPRVNTNTAGSSSWTNGGSTSTTAASRTWTEK